MAKTNETKPTASKANKPASKVATKTTNVIDVVKKAKQAKTGIVVADVDPVAVGLIKPEIKVAAPQRKEKPVDASKEKQKEKEKEKEKAKKPKLVRDSFTMPEAEYAVLGEVKRACLKAGIEVKKSELLRVGVALLRNLDTAKLKDVLADLPTLKAGRPKKSK